MTNEDARSMMHKSGYSPNFIEWYATPLFESGWVSTSLEDQATLRTQHTDGSLTSEFVVDLHTGIWVLFDVTGTTNAVANGEERLTPR